MPKRARTKVSASSTSGVFFGSHEGTDGVRRTPSNQCPLGVGSTLPRPLWADVRLHILMTHHNDAGHANSTWCQQSKSVVHPYNRFYCLCGLASMADPVRHVNTSDGTVPTNYEYACAYNECDTACLNTIGFTYAIAAGLSTLFFFGGGLTRGY